MIYGCAPPTKNMRKYTNI